MIKLEQSAGAWGTDQFRRVLKSEVEALDAGTLPLARATAGGGQIDDSNIAVTVLGISEDDEAIMANVYLFFSELIGGCNCSEDPVAQNVQCELLIRLNKATAEAKFSFIDG